MTTKKFQNKYRIKSARLEGYDYSQNGYYFVTICTKNRECFFGDIKNEKMQLSKIGKIAKKFWLEIPDHFSFVELGEFIVMPNHFHGIVVIYKSHVETLHATSLRDKRQKKYHGKNMKLSKISPTKYSLSSIIRSYKSAVTRNSKQINSDFAWQPRFHDYIIGNEKSYQIISEYIIHNPEKWKNDKFFVE